MSSQLITVVGGTGFAGAATVEALIARRQAVRVISRKAPASLPPGVEFRSADASSLSSLTPALEGSTAVILCARPDYWKWPQELVPMISAVAEATRRAGARLVYCDNVYAYGRFEGLLTEATPYRPHGPKGRARKEAAELLMRLHEEGTLPVTIGRAADFYGPGVDYPNLKMLFGAALAGKTVRVLGKGNLPHSVSYMGDVGAGLATLALRDEALGQVWHLPVAPPTTEVSLAQKIVQLAGTASGVKTTPDWAVHALFSVMGLFSTMMKELPEVLYQHEEPFVVDDSRFRTTFNQSALSQEVALRRTLDWWRATLATPERDTVAKAA